MNKGKLPKKFEISRTPKMTDRKKAFDENCGYWINFKRIQFDIQLQSKVLIAFNLAANSYNYQLKFHYLVRVSAYHRLQIEYLLGLTTF